MVTHLPRWFQQKHLIALALLATFGCSCSDSPDEVAGPLVFETAQVRLAVESLSIEANGRTFTADRTSLVSGWRDPSNRLSPMEISWSEHGTEMRLLMQFVSDGTSWWADEIRSFDGKEPGSWLVEQGVFFKSPLGQQFVGDASLEHVGLTGLRLQAFTTPEPCIRPTKPVAIVPLGHEVHGWAAPGNGTGFAAMLVSTGSCQRIHNLEHVRFEVEIEDNSIAEPSPMTLERGVPSTDIVIHGPGETMLNVIAIDTQTQTPIDSIQVAVNIRRPPANS